MVCLVLELWVNLTNTINWQIAAHLGDLGCFRKSRKERQTKGNWKFSLLLWLVFNLKKENIQGQTGGLLRLLSLCFLFFLREKPNKGKNYTNLLISLALPFSSPEQVPNQEFGSWFMRNFRRKKRKEIWAANFFNMHNCFRLQTPPENQDKMKGENNSLSYKLAIHFTREFMSTLDKPTNKVNNKKKDNISAKSIHLFIWVRLFDQKNKRPSYTKSEAWTQSYKYWINIFVTI